MPAPIEIETARLLLRQWKQADFQPFARLNADPQVMEFFLAPLTREESDAVAQRCQQQIAENGWGFWAVELKSLQQFIGFVGLNQPAYRLPFGPCTEIGWRLDKAHWGHGYATEAAQAALHTGFTTLHLAEIVAFTTLQNLRSQAVMQRLGMHRQAETFGHPLVPSDHPLKTHCLYKLSQKQWLAAQSAR